MVPLNIMILGVTFASLNILGRFWYMYLVALFGNVVI